MAEIIHLYDTGNQFDAVTGGWKGVATTPSQAEREGEKSSVVFKDKMVALRAAGYADDYWYDGKACMITNKLIDLTYVSTITATADGRCAVYVSDKQNTHETITSEENNKTLDVSGLTGSYYVGVQHNYAPGNGTKATTTNVTAVYMVIDNYPPTKPGYVESQPDPRVGQNWANAWGASTDADGDEITYTVEYAFDSDAFIEAGTTTGTVYNVPIPAAIYPGDVIPISWAAADDATGYAIQRRINGGAWENLATVSGTTYADKAPASAKKHTKVQYRIASVTNGAVASEYTDSADVWVYGVGGEE